MAYFRFLLAGVLLLPSFMAQSQTFQQFLQRVNVAPDSQRTALVDSFMNAVGNLPLREQDTLVHFIYRGSPLSVTVPGDANNWTVSAYPMSRLATTDLWYVTRVFESDARLDYKFVLNGSTWILDPRNPHTVNGGFGPNSELCMPAFVMPPEIQYYPTIPHGTLWDTTYFSVNLGNTRTIRIYTPPGYASSSDSLPVILFHDGLEYITLAQANNVFDYLISENRIKPIIAVFVPPVNRTPEYAGNQMSQFSAFIVNELLPYIDARFRTRRSPSSRATLGASNGGNIALWLGLNHSNVFGNVAAQSSNVIGSISSRFQNGMQLDLKLYLDLGTYDIPELIPLVRNLVSILQSRSYVFQYHEYHEGHSWGNWRAHIDNALEMFFPPTSSSVEQATALPLVAVLDQNHPNPFNPNTTIQFSLPRSEFVTLKVFNILGEQIAMLVSATVSAGTHNVEWNAQGMASGIYFYRLQAGTSVQTKKLLLLR